MSSCSLAPGAESSCQAFPAYFHLREHPASAFSGHRASGAGRAGRSLGRCDCEGQWKPCVSLTRSTVRRDGSTSQALSQQEEQVKKHQSSLARQAQAWARPQTVQSCPHEAFLTKAERCISASVQPSVCFRPVPFEALFCCLSNILGTCVLLRVICLKPRQPFVAQQGNTPSSPEALANTITAPTSFLFSPSSQLVRTSLKWHKKNRFWSQRGGAVRGIAIRQQSLKWRHFDHKKSMWHITSALNPQWSVRDEMAAAISNKR